MEYLGAGRQDGRPIQPPAIGSARRFGLEERRDGPRFLLPAFGLRLLEVWGLGFAVLGVGFGVWGLGFGL